HVGRWRGLPGVSGGRLDAGTLGNEEEPPRAAPARAHGADRQRAEHERASALGRRPTSGRRRLRRQGGGDPPARAGPWVDGDRSCRPRHCLMLTTVCKISSPTRMMRALASKPRWAVMRSVNWRARSTLEPSRAPGSKVPAPPAPGLPTWASPEFEDTVNMFWPAWSRPPGLSKVASWMVSGMVLGPWSQLALVEPSEQMLH